MEKKKATEQLEECKRTISELRDKMLEGYEAVTDGKPLAGEIKSFKEAINDLQAFAESWSMIGRE